CEFDFVILAISIGFPPRVGEWWSEGARERASERGNIDKTFLPLSHSPTLPLSHSPALSLSHSSAILFDLPRPPQRASRLRPGVLAFFQYLRAVDEHVFHTDGELVRLLESGAVGDGLRVEDDDVGEIPLPQKPTTIKLQVGRGQARQTADRFFKG